MSEANALTVSEQGRLGEMEAIIDRGLQTFYEVGKALTIIRDEQLYRVGYATFEEYCEERWQMSRAYAYRTIGAADVVKSLSPIGDIPLPKNEAQARPLTSLEPEQRQQAWTKAVEESGGKPNARQVQQAADEVTGKVRNLADGIKVNVNAAAYESIHSLQSFVLFWARNHWPALETLLVMEKQIELLNAMKDDHKHGQWTDLSTYLVRQGKVFRVNDLRQALNNALDSMRFMVSQTVISQPSEPAQEAPAKHWGLSNGIAFWKKVNDLGVTRSGILEFLQPGAKYLTDLTMTKEEAFGRLADAPRRADPYNPTQTVNGEPVAAAVLNGEQTATSQGQVFATLPNPPPTDMMIATNSLRVNIESISVKIRQELAQEFRWWSDDDKRKLPGLQGDRRDVCYQRSILLVTIANMLDVN